jgi:hypothetical protein
MKEVLKIFLSNWVNLVVIFLAVYVIGFISAMINDKFTFGEAVLGVTYSVALYGIVFWVGFLVGVLVLDIILFGFSRIPGHTTMKLAIEWVLIRTPFIYWLLRYNQWIFLIAVLAFLVGQYLRRPYILKILE